MAKSIDLSIGRMQQRQPIDRQVDNPDDLQPARVNTFRDRLCARFHRQWRFRKARRLIRLTDKLFVR